MDKLIKRQLANVKINIYLWITVNFFAQIHLLEIVKY